MASGFLSAFFDGFTAEVFWDGSVDPMSPVRFLRMLSILTPNRIS